MTEDDLRGRTAIVTGAGSGIGRASAALFAAHGARVVCADISESGRAVVESIGDGGGDAVFCRADVRDAAACRQLVEAAIEAYGQVDILFNVAGVIRRATVLETDEAEWDRVIEVNLKSVYLLARLVIPHMVAHGGGAIVNTASGWGLTAGPRAAAYCAAKGAVVQLTKAMAIDHAADGIRVNCICPGDIGTPMLTQEATELGEPDDEFLIDAAARPMARIGTPEEVAEAALYLVGDSSRYVNGLALVIDGGGLIR